MSLPGIGAKGADKILEMRETKEDLELEDTWLFILLCMFVCKNICITDQIFTLGRFCIFN
jgi:hypothetical protein